MSKPIISIPASFADNGIKTDFPSSKINNGFDNVSPDILAGDNLNKFIDDTYKGLNGVLELYDTKVNKSGDTMTGALNNMNTSVTKGTNPSSNKHWEWRNLDNNQNPAEWHTNRMSAFQTTLYPNGTVETQIKAYKNDPTVPTTADIKLSITSSGVKSCEFPNTTCCDGQWVDSFHLLSTTIAQGNYEIDVSSFLPSDRTSYDYEIMVHFTGSRSSGDTNTLVYISKSMINVTTDADWQTADVYGSANFDGNHGEAQSISCIVIARKNVDKFYFNVKRANLTNSALVMTKYRRIGTNA